MKNFLITLIILMIIGWPTPVAANNIDVDITFQRISKDTWQVTYQFSESVVAVHLGPPVEGYRQKYWNIKTPGVFMINEAGEEKLEADVAVSEIALQITRYTIMPEANYMPFAWFSDGGASMYLGYFMGDVEAIEGRTTPHYKLTLKGRPGEKTLMPANNTGEPIFAYFGPQVPVETNSIILIADEGLPRWLKDAIEETVPVLAEVYSNALQMKPSTKPIIMVPAGDLDIFSNEQHIKGGALKSQFNLTFSGGLPAKSEKQNFQKLIAHEMAHLWQRPEGINDFGVPWVYEGGAEAMALAALQQAGLWDAAQVRKFSEEAAKHCDEDLGDMDLAEAEKNNNWAAAYSCGYGMYAQTGVDVLALWALMIRHPDAPKTGYTPEILYSALPVN